MIRLKRELNGKLTTVTAGSLTMYFSYETCIGFKKWADELVLSKNIWSSTTGKHLNHIDPDKEYRVDHGEFKKQLAKALEATGQ